MSSSSLFSTPALKPFKMADMNGMIKEQGFRKRRLHPFTFGARQIENSLIEMSSGYIRLKASLETGEKIIMKNNKFFQIFEKALVSYYVNSKMLYESICNNADSIFGVEYNEVFPISLKTPEKLLDTRIDYIRLDSDFSDVDVCYRTSLTGNDFYIEPLYREEFLDLNPGVSLDDMYHDLIDICDFTFDQLYDIYDKYCNENEFKVLAKTWFIKNLKSIAAGK